MCSHRAYCHNYCHFHYFWKCIIIVIIMESVDRSIDLRMCAFACIQYCTITLRRCQCNTPILEMVVLPEHPITTPKGVKFTHAYEHPVKVLSEHPIFNSACIINFSSQCFNWMGEHPIKTSAREVLTSGILFYVYKSNWETKIFTTINKDDWTTIISKILKT